MTNSFQRICIFCVISGVVVPWGLLLLAGVLGFATDAEWAARMSAYAAGLGLFVMALSFLFARFLHFIARQ
jgi:hypothetical protein